jgi:hypothetical protein
MTRTLFLLAFLFAISGCTTTQQAMVRANNRYVGKNFDEFVLERGIPTSKYQLNNGDYVYVWNSGIISYNMPATTTMNGTVSPYGSYYGTATTTGGGTLNVFCEVRIHTKSDGTIISIEPVRDTIGNWEMSRCSECFK